MGKPQAALGRAPPRGRNFPNARNSEPYAFCKAHQIQARDLNFPHKCPQDGHARQSLFPTENLSYSPVGNLRHADFSQILKYFPTLKKSRRPRA
ncbi:MAG: hypothetical protein DBX55_05265 [Verrucomicrobia bacterium]|nr:MAG: hypothetical protein DBX55_05265 [Verrucomicrobiota bacterium]